MIRFFTNRQLAGRLGINLARWKRWSREFLPPDPLGGLQSGLARQYTEDEALAVFLGGHLVAELGFAIPEARRILEDLEPVLAESGFYRAWDRKSAGWTLAGNGPAGVTVDILRRAPAFAYRVRRRLQRRRVAGETGGFHLWEEQLAEKHFGAEVAPEPCGAEALSWCTLDLGALRAHFQACMTPADR